MGILLNIASLLKNMNPSDVAKAKAAVTGTAKSLVVSPQVTSITSYATNAMYFFPVLVTENCSKNTAIEVTKHAEREFSHFLRALFALQPIAEFESGDELSLSKYLGRFHQNINNAHIPMTVQLNSAFDDEWVFSSAPPLNEAQTLLSKHNGRKTLLSEASGSQQIASMLGKVDLSYNQNTGNVIPNNKVLNINGAIGKSSSILRQSDLKDFTKAEPTYVIVQVTAFVKGVNSSNNNRAADAMKFEVPLAVKAQMHVIESEQTMQYIIDSVDNRGKLNGLIRWTTGEMLSLNDILFGLSKIKRKIAEKDKNINRWANINEERKRLSAISTATAGRMAFLPNTTIVLTMEEARQIELKSGFSILNPKVANKVLKEHFLLGLIIIDDMMETCYILYNGFSEFAEYPYSILSKENEGMDREMKNLIRALGTR